LRATASRAVTAKMKTWLQHVTALKTTSLGGAVSLGGGWPMKTTLRRCLLVDADGARQ
jgi:hypothetical protein